MVRRTKAENKDIRSMFSSKAKPSSSTVEESEDKATCSVASAPILQSELDPIEDHAEEMPASKRQKTKAAKPVGTEKKKSVQPLKCDICKQLLNSDALKMYGGDSPDSVEEFIALASESLSLFDAESNGEGGWNEKPQHRITDFTVYDDYGHLCPFDTGLIDQNIQLFFSGYLKPIYDDSPNIEGGVRAAKLGPIDAWYIAGFDGGERELIGFTTMYADYLLSTPSEQYTPIFETLREKTFLSKTVIEFLEADPGLELEDLINQVQLVVPPENCAKFTEDTLHRHAQFLVEQIESYDRAAEDEDPLLITIPAVRSLISLVGVILGKTGSKQRAAPRAPKPKGPCKTKSTDISHATVTPLIEASFEGIFVDQMGVTDRKRRCNECEVCKAPDCGECPTCKDKVKFGGSGKRRQACLERRCPNMAVRNAEQDDIEEEVEDEIVTDTLGKREKKISGHSDGTLVGDVTHSKGKKAFYRCAELGGKHLVPGDYVTVAPDTQGIDDYIGRIITMYKKGSNSFLHIHWLSGVKDTVLGAAHDSHELFLSDTCDNIPLGSVVRKVDVNYTPPPPNWSMIGGQEVPENKSSFYFKLWYDTDKGRFEDPLPEYLNWDPADGACPACVRKQEAEKASVPSIDETGRRLYFGNTTYTVGDYIYLNPDSYAMPSRPKLTIPKIRKDNVDDEMFPEYYRKTDYIKGSNELAPEPFRVARIVDITSKSDTLKSASVKLTVKKLYRPGNIENVCVDSPDINILYYSNDQVKVSAEKLRGKCVVKHSDDIQDLGLYSHLTDHFYISESWDKATKTLRDVPTEARSANKGKRRKEGKDGSKFRKLRTLDVFAGCGGLSEGFHQAGIAKSSWAIEFFSEAAQAYKLNNPEAVVFNEDCNKILKMAMDGEKTNALGQKIPQKGEVELLCGGPPCQGFSGMNRFNAREYSQFKNSLISTYLSYCEFYRPKYFLLENVRNFVSYKKNMVLKLCLSSLVNMGYQCTFGVLQAGCYGVAQTRRRAFILAAAPGELLPQYPEPRHVFSPKALSLSVMVDCKQYKSHITRLDSAPLRTITVRDMMSDLPVITNGASKRELPYDTEPKSWFQRHIRNNAEFLTDHICKEMNPLVAIRMRHIPLTPGSDWRDLPNTSVTLPDGTKTPKLVYTHNDSKGGKLKGICSCAEGRKCEPMDKQNNTLIPWCLPHTGNRHNHWAGLYGRVFWDGFFSTTITNPEPMGKQGRVLHPEQHRLVSVRECARSQGFPDTYKFYGNLLDKHRQVGNAVPPPLARAIGEEIAKSLEVVENRRRKVEISRKVEEVENKLGLEVENGVAKHEGS